MRLRCLGHSAPRDPSIKFRPMTKPVIKSSTALRALWRLESNTHIEWVGEFFAAAPFLLKENCVFFSTLIWPEQGRLEINIECVRSLQVNPGVTQGSFHRESVLPEMILICWETSLSRAVEFWVTFDAWNRFAVSNVGQLGIDLSSKDEKASAEGFLR